MSQITERKQVMGRKGAEGYTAAQLKEIRSNLITYNMDRLGFSRDKAERSADIAIGAIIDPDDTDKNWKS